MSAADTSFVATMDRHLKVLDTSAIVTLFKKKGSDGEAGELGGQAYAKRLEQAHARGGIVIPDQVLFELTDILPSSLPYVMRQLAEAKNAGRLEDEVQQMAAQSALKAGTLRPNIEGVLIFMAHHPEAVRETECGNTFSRLCYAQLAPEQMPDDYVLTKGDMGDLLKHSQLRVHIGDLLQMGFIHRHDFKDRADKLGSARSRKRRFITVDDFMKMVEGYGFLPDETIKKLHKYSEKELKTLNNRIKEQNKRLASGEQPSPEVTKTKLYLTYGFQEVVLEREKQEDEEPLTDEEKYYQPLLPQRNMPRTFFGQKNNDTVPIREMTENSDLLLEHCFYGGILNEEKIPEVATALGFSAPKANQTDAEYKKELEKEGFFERRVSLKDVQKLSDDPAYTALKSKADAAALAQRKAEAIKKAANNRNSQTESLQAFDPLKGAAYEYAFVDALINGRINEQEFIRLATQSGALSQSNEHPPAQGTPDGGIWMSAIDEKLEIKPEEVTCYINKKNFLTRSKIRHGGLVNVAPNLISETRFQDNHFQSLPFTDLVQLARSDASQKDDSKRSNAARALRAMIYPAIVRDASAFRETAMTILDEGLTQPESRLLQIEHDWIRRHKNHWGGRTPEQAKEVNKAEGQNFPFFTSYFASLHEQRNVARNNLGETATCELAATLSESHDKVAIVTHDNSIEKETQRQNMPENTMPAFTGFSPALKRYHSELKPHMDEVAATLREKAIPVVATNAWISTLHTPTTLLDAASLPSLPPTERYRA